MKIILSYVDSILLESQDAYKSNVCKIEFKVYLISKTKIL